MCERERERDKERKRDNIKEKTHRYIFQLGRSPYLALERVFSARLKFANLNKEITGTVLKHNPKE